MHAFAASGASFLVCVLWFDLMFDVLVARSPADKPVAAEALQSISAYYRRVTTEARPMNSLIGFVMLAILALLLAESISGAAPVWAAWVSLGAALSAVGLARVRIMPNAVRLGRAADAIDEQSRLARSIYYDHLYCLAAMFSVLALQLSAPWLA